jgi:hypothetical protein
VDSGESTVAAAAKDHPMFARGPVMENVMARRAKKPWPALKHGIFSTMAVLPGEDRAAFEKLHKELRMELAPAGALEDEVVANLSRLIWRKRNLGTFRIAGLAKSHDDHLREEMIPAPSRWTYLSQLQPNFVEGADAGEIEVATQHAENQSRKELGDTYKLVELADLVTLEELSLELDMHERLDAMIDRCLKRLLFVRGIKSIPANASAASASPSRAAS